MLRVQQGAGLDALMELESVVSAAESVDEGTTAPMKRFTYLLYLICVSGDSSDHLSCAIICIFLHFYLKPTVHIFQLFF